MRKPIPQVLSECYNDTEDAFNAETIQLIQTSETPEEEEVLLLNGEHPYNTNSTILSAMQLSKVDVYFIKRWIGTTLRDAVFLFDNRPNLHPNLAEAQRQFQLDRTRTYDV